MSSNAATASSTCAATVYSPSSLLPAIQPSSSPLPPTTPDRRQNGQRQPSCRTSAHLCLMPSSHRRHRQDKTVSSRLVGVGGVNWVGDSHRQFSVVLSILQTEQFCPVSSTVWRHLWTSLDLSPIQFTPRTPTRQDYLVLSMSAVWTRH